MIEAMPSAGRQLSGGGGERALFLHQGRQSQRSGRGGGGRGHKKKGQRGNEFPGHSTPLPQRPNSMVSVARRAIRSTLLLARPAAGGAARDLGRGPPHASRHRPAGRAQRSARHGRCGSAPGLTLAIMFAGVKWAAQHGVGVVESLFYRQLGTALAALAFVALGPGLASLRTKRIAGHVVRMGIGLVAMGLNFLAFALLPMAEATAIGFSVPIFSTLLAAILLGEKTGPWRWGAVLAGFIGVLVIVQPGSGHIALTGGLVAHRRGADHRLRDHRHPPARRDRGRGDDRLLVRREQPGPARPRDAVRRPGAQRRRVRGDRGHGGGRRGRAIVPDRRAALRPGRAGHADGLSLAALVEPARLPRFQPGAVALDAASARRSSSPPGSSSCGASSGSSAALAPSWSSWQTEPMTCVRIRALPAVAARRRIRRCRPRRRPTAELAGSSPRSAGAG